MMRDVELYEQGKVKFEELSEPVQKYVAEEHSKPES